jgi:hypothetical protein
VRDGLLGHRNDLVPPDLGPAECAGAGGRNAPLQEKLRSSLQKTDRERGYIVAIGAFYRDSDRLDHQARAQAYSDALRLLSKQLPDDHEAQIFYALSLLGTAPPGDASFANQKQAAAILNSLLPLEPQHPGIAHYMIHAFDYPQLAADALPAARAYSKIAPDSPHALHMPSHIFMARILVDDRLNLASADATAGSPRDGTSAQPPGTRRTLDHRVRLFQISIKLRRAGPRPPRQDRLTIRRFGLRVGATPARFVLERRD